MSGIGFTDPYYFLLLALALPVVAAASFLGFQRIRWAREQYGERELVERYSKPFSAQSLILTLAGWLAAITLTVTALAGYRPATPVKVYSGSLQVVTVFQVTRSMGAEDYRNSLPQTWKLRFFNAHGTRLDEAKYIVESDILPSIENDQVGVVTYQGAALPLTDLTTDFSYVRYELDNYVYIGNAPYGSTLSNTTISDIAVGLQAAIDQFKRFGSPGTQKVIVLFSDGDNTADQSSMDKVVQELSAAHIRLVIIGLGGAPVPIPQYNANGQFTGYYQYGNGDTPTTGLNESPLTSLASEAHGTYIRLNPSSLPRIELPSQLSNQWRYEIQDQLLYPYPLALALLIVILLGLKGWFGPLTRLWSPRARRSDVR